MPGSVTRKSSPTSSAISPTASRSTTALIPNGALPLYSNHPAFPNSSLQTGSSSSFLARSFVHPFIPSFLHSFNVHSLTLFLRKNLHMSECLRTFATDLTCSFWYMTRNKLRGEDKKKIQARREGCIFIVVCWWV